MSDISPDLTLRLGDFEFDDLEIPERIPFGGTQKLAVHELVGGVRVLDAMGAFDAPIEWSGLLRGPAAVSRAKQLDAMRAAGLQLDLTWHEFRYKVVIESFKAEFERFYQIPYTITVQVVGTQGKQEPSSPANVDTQMRADMSSASGFASSIGDSQLSGQMSSLSSSVSAVPDFGRIGPITSAAILLQINGAQSRAAAIETQQNAIVAGASALGGVQPSVPIGQQTSAMQGQMSAMDKLQQAQSLQSVLGRMSTNLKNAGSTGQTVNTAGGNLFQIAADQYGDATAWTTLAKANGITDPQITGIKSINIPPAPSGSAPVGGVLSG